MKIQRPLSDVFVRGGGSVGSARRTLAAGTIRSRAMRAILVLALAFSSLGAGALAWSANGSADSAHVSGRLADGPAHAAEHARAMPWMY
jgi:hypothetical protein